MYPLWRTFSKSSVFLDHERRLSVDGEKKISVDMA